MKNLWFVAQQLGAPSEIWLLRQLERLKSFNCTEITWTDTRRQTSSDNVILMGAPTPGLNGLGKRRWLHRLQRAFNGNYYGASRTEQKTFIEIAHKKGKPDVILAHFGHAALRFLPIAQKVSCPLVVHFHGTDITDSVKNNRWYRNSLLKSLSSFSACVCVGEAQYETLISLGVDPKKLHIIPCGVPTQEFARNTKPSGRTTGVKFATLSRLVKQKGIDVCIHALAEVKAAQLLIMGDGPEKPYLIELTKELGISDRVTFAGSVSPEVAKMELEDCDVFLQHSLEVNGWVEGFGVSVSEAASMELPVIVSATGGLLDQVISEKTGFIVPMNDHAGMVEKMKLLASRPELRKQMGAAGRQNVVKNFDTDKQVTKLEVVLRSTFEKN